jgi:transcriptional regulator with XRE-family HTH domain
MTSHDDGLRRDRARSRRPILEDEVAALEELGREVRRLRELAGMSRGSVAWATGLDQSTLWRIETGRRRTREVTLRRLVVALVAARPELGEVDGLVAELVRVAGGSLAPPSRYADRVERRLRRRLAKRERKRARIRGLLEALDGERTVHAGRPPDRESPPEPPWWAPVRAPDSPSNKLLTWLDVIEGAAE